MDFLFFNGLLTYLVRKRMIYTLFLFDRTGFCLVHKMWNQPNKTQKEVVSDCKLMYGMLFGLKSFVNKASPAMLGENENERLYSFQTDVYKVHYFETLTGLRFVLTTDPSVPHASKCLRQIYSFYVAYALKNPLYKRGSTLDCPFFLIRTKRYVESLPFFSNSPSPVSDS